MRGEDDRRAFGHCVEFLHEHRALFLKPFNDKAVVDNFVAHIDRRAVFRRARVSTIWIARSTPAQNPRGAARSIVSVLF